MWPPPHHYTYALNRFLDQSPDLTVLVRDGQVLCHKPVLACHSYFLKDVLLHSDTDVLALPDFGKEEITNLIQVLYGQVSETSVSKQLLEMLGIDVHKMPINPGESFISESSDQIVDLNLGRKQENEEFPMVEYQLTGNENRSIFDIDDLEEENSYKCCNCSTILPSLSNLCAHMQTCGEAEDQEIIYQCSVCNLICSSLEDLGSHMDIHSNETPVNQEVILGDIEEAVINADFVIADVSMDAETNAQEAINEEVREEIILEEVGDDNHLVTDDPEDVQDPSIETTEVTVTCDDAMENDFHSQKIEVSPKDIIRNKDISSISEKTIPRKNISDIKTDTNTTILEDFSHTSLDKMVLNSKLENSNDFDMDKNSSEIKKVENSRLYSCQLCSKSFSTEAVLLLHTQSAHKKMNMSHNNLDLIKKSDQNEKPILSDLSTEPSLLSNTQSSHKKINLHLSDNSDGNKTTTSYLSTESVSRNLTQSDNQKIILDQINLDLVSKSNGNECLASSYVSSTSVSNTNHTESTNQKINFDQNNLDLTQVLTQNELQTRSEFACHFCQHKFDSLYSLNEHTVTFHTELLETGEMLNEDDILTKAIEMTDFSKIDDQVANQEATSLIYSCTLCDSSFSSTKALTQHVNSNHVLQPPNHTPVSCNYCDIHFITRSTLAKHYQTAHPGQQPIFQCPQCGKALKTCKSLERHEVMHTEVRPFQCGQCRAKFHWGEALRTHAKRGCKPRPSFSLPAPIQSASRPSPNESFSLSVPSQSANLPIPSFNQPTPCQSTSLPIPSFSLPTPSQSTSLPILNSNPVVSISFDSNTNSMNMSCTNCFLKFGSHQDYNSHICTKQSQTVRSNPDEIFIPAPTEQSLAPKIHLTGGQNNIWNNPFSEIGRQLSDYQEEHSNQGLNSFEKIVQLNSTVSQNEIEAVASRNHNVISLKAPFLSSTIIGGCLTHKYSCNDCQYNTNLRKSYKKHLESQKHKENSSVKRYFCDQCDMAFGTLKFLDDHINRKHKIKKIKQKLLSLKRMKMEIEATKFEEIHDGNEIGELMSKSGRKIIPRMFADGDKVFTPLLNCLRKRTIPINKASNIEPDCNTTLEGIDMINETEELENTADSTKKTDIDVIATKCDLCQDFFVSRRRFFLHMLTHVPAGIRANLPEGQHGWCPHCPGPVPVEEINSHAADSHPEILAPSQDEEFGDIPCDADLEKMLEDGFDLDELSQDELDMLDISEDPVDSTQCPPSFVKIVPVDLDRYGINVMDYM